MPKKDKDEKEASVKKAAGAKGSRATRAQRRKAYYGARPLFTAANKKRKVAKHIRQHPDCLQTQKYFEENYGKATLAGHLASPTAKAKRRMKRRLRESKH